MDARDWIKIEDRLPDSARHVLVSLLCVADQPPTRENVIAHWSKGQWLDDMGEDSVESEDYRVTHWMELPLDPADAVGFGHEGNGKHK